MTIVYQPRPYVLIAVEAAMRVLFALRRRLRRRS